MSTAIGERQGAQKVALVDQLKRTPIIQVACEKTGISRATFYRWRKEDAAFAAAADEALSHGAGIVNDMAESKLIALIREGNITALIYWLKHHHPAYATRVELAVSQKPREELTPEQQELVKKALTLATLPSTSPSLPLDDHDQPHTRPHPTDSP